VRIDATWGLPDSLLFHPHDSYRVDVVSGVVERYLRCKTDFIDVDAHGQWLSRSAGTPWDWKPALTDNEAIQIAQMSARLAAHVGGSLEVMFFVGAPSGEAPPVLPWFFSGGDGRLSDVPASPGFFVGERVLIRNDEDLTGLEARLTGTEGRPRLALALRPETRLLRSRDFIQRVARLAKQRNLPVELEGSQLSHAYYVLDDEGARVRCVDPWRSPERRQAFGKLVRDLIPVKIERRGELATVYSADREELLPLIREKVVEEALEYYWERDAGRSLEELADLLEIVRAAARVQGVEFDLIEDLARDKRRERGGFEGGVVLVETREGADPPFDTLAAGAERGFFETTRGVGRRRGTARRRVVRLPGRRLVLPLVPPEGAEVNGEFTVALSSDEEARIIYGKSSVLVQLRARPSSPGPGQMAFDGLDIGLEAQG
jgi:predicted house-cleaning noncanonical NTP pyrophosphatase (MazG superfamily)